MIFSTLTDVLPMLNYMQPLESVRSIGYNL